MTRHLNDKKLSLVPDGELLLLMQKIATDHTNDKETAHVEADMILCEVARRLSFEGHEIADLFDKMDKWYA